MKSKLIITAITASLTGATLFGVNLYKQRKSKICNSDSEESRARQWKAIKEKISTMESMDRRMEEMVN